MSLPEWMVGALVILLIIMVDNGEIDTGESGTIG